MQRILAATSVFIFLVLLSCLDPYSLPGNQTASHLLVVDGFMNSSSQTVTVKLSRTLTLDDDFQFPPETGAIVKIENSGGGTIDLLETNKGTYERSGQNFTELSIGCSFEAKMAKSTDLILWN
jgi:hypothetical protein